MENIKNYEFKASGELTKSYLFSAIQRNNLPIIIKSSITSLHWINTEESQGIAVEEESQGIPVEEEIFETRDHQDHQTAKGVDNR